MPPLPFDLPLGVLTDSYKAAHFELFPPGTEEVVAVSFQREKRERGRRPPRAGPSRSLSSSGFMGPSTS